MKARMPSRPARLPSAAAATLGVPAGEKVIAWGSTPDGDEVSFVVATNRALYSEALGGRTPWSRISKATWEEPALSVTVLDDAGRPRRPLRLRIEESNDLPAAVYDRVTASVVVSERVELRPGAKALLVARTGSDSGEISWTVVFDAGLDPRDPELRRAADSALSDLRGSLGI